jgi:PTH1 family peptidyl-tRNA hydrolase
VGWWSLDDLAERSRAQFKASGANAETAEVEINSSRVVLIRPMTYVNRSGDALRHLMRKHHVDAAHVIVIYDDLNLEPGKVRIRKQGGAGGHNGMKSIISTLGTDEFVRIRIGVGRPAVSGEQVDYVLGRMAPRERKLVRDASTRAADAAEAAVRDGLDFAMNRFNS